MPSGPLRPLPANCPEPICPAINLGEKLDTVIGLFVGDLNNPGGGMIAEIHEIKTQVAQMVLTLATVQSDLDGLDQRAVKHSGDLTSVELRVDAHDKRLNAIDRRLDTIDNQLLSAVTGQFTANGDASRANWAKVTDALWKASAVVGAALATFLGLKDHIK